MQTTPFSEEHLAAAAELLAQRQRRNRTVPPKLPDRFESPPEAEVAIRAPLDRYPTALLNLPNL